MNYRENGFVTNDTIVTDCVAFNCYRIFPTVKKTTARITHACYVTKWYGTVSN